MKTKLEHRMAKKVELVQKGDHFISGGVNKRSLFSDHKKGISSSAKRLQKEIVYKYGS
ncbi:hypothetical protein [Chitinophaga nivalis]|uniref:Uncharacterized protein n=1 Tax=Chitinophaga nivalis TaxID=2991709 RepID=A0ABT3IGT7_9BACT|nr:hypothetical protein [Chitinophaga nivalis]MCW3483161.1 hypothetical protein [Chitinophaga nivalis]